MLFLQIAEELVMWFLRIAEELCNMLPLRIAGAINVVPANRRGGVPAIAEEL